MLTASFTACDPIRTSQPPLRASSANPRSHLFAPNGVTAYLSNRDTLESGRSFILSRDHAPLLRPSFDNRFNTKRAIAAGA